MKLTLSIICIIFFKLSCTAQNLSFPDIQYLFEHNIDNCDTYLAKKKYYFMKSEEAKDNEDCSTTTWAYKRNINDNGAKSFLAKTCDEANKGIIFYQFKEKGDFENIKAICKNQGFKFIEKYTSPYGALWFAYQSNKFKIEFGSSIDDYNNNNVYMISFSKL